MLASKSRPQDGSIDTPNTNIRLLMIILWQKLYFRTKEKHSFFIVILHATIKKYTSIEFYRHLKH